MEGKKVLSLLLQLLLLLSLGKMTVFSAQEEYQLSRDFLKEGSALITENLDPYEENPSLQKLMPGFDAAKVLEELVFGEFKEEPEKMIQTLKNFFFEEIKASFVIGLKVIGTLFFIGLIRNMQSSFGSSTVYQVAYFSGYVMVSWMLLGLVHQGFSMIFHVVKQASEFVMAAIPLLFGLMASSGALASAVMIRPFYLFSILLLFSLLKKIIFPLIAFQIVMTFVSGISDKIQIKHLSNLNKGFIVWALGGFMTIFVGILSLQGTLGYSIDHVTAKTAKFTIGTLIPFAGKYLSDATETVLAYSMLLKNAAGILIMLILLGICIFPLLKCLATLLLLKSLAIVSEMMGESKLAHLMSEMSQVYFLLTGVVGMILLIFYLSICIVMGSLRFL